MSYITEELRAKAAAFNQKYGCDVDLADYETKANVENPTEEAWKLAYQNTFRSALKSSFAKMVDGKVDFNFQIVDMFNDFESMIMNPYRKECEKANAAVAPKAYGGMGDWDVREYLSDCLNMDAPTNRATVNRSRYEKGDLRIRDMREYTLSVMKKEANEITEMEKKNIASYVVALSATNKSRSLAWKIFHPIRNNAEKRDSALMAKLLEEKFPEAYDSLKFGATEPFKEIRGQSYDIDHYTIPQEKVGRENISVNDLNQPQKTEIAKPVEPQPTLEKNPMSINK